jgi:prepilin peptidase CpaA
VTLRLLLAILAGVAAYTDWRWRRIPNWLTVGALAGAFAIRGPADFRAAAMGLALALAVTLPLFALRGLGGGDVKLMAAAGAIAGPGAFLELFVLNAVLGGVAALAALVGRGRWTRTGRNIGRIFGSLARGRAPHWADPELDIAHPGAVSIPRGVVFAVATALFLASGRWR